MNPQRQFKIEERDHVLVRSLASQSDISSDIASEERRPRYESTYTDVLDRAQNKLIRMDVSLGSERRENDFYIYDKKVSGGVKITEHTLVFSRKKLEREEVRVEVNPLRLPSKLIYFEYDCKF